MAFRIHGADGEDNVVFGRWNRCLADNSAPSGGYGACIGGPRGFRALAVECSAGSSRNGLCMPPTRSVCVSPPDLIVLGSARRRIPSERTDIFELLCL